LTWRAASGGPARADDQIKEDRALARSWVMGDTFQSERPAGRFAWLFELPPKSERTMRMEALIARIRVMVMVVNTIILALLLDTSGMHMDAAWWLVSLGYLYSIPVALLEPYRRWRVFQTSLLTAGVDSAMIAVFVAVTGASESPFFLLYYLSVTAVALRFDLRQSVAACLWYATTYALVFLWTWDTGTNDAGILMMRLCYMLFISVGVGHLAREEKSRWKQIEEIERLNAENIKLHTRNERAARYDRLTGILNRAFFEKDAQRELRKARGSSTAYYSVLFCDIDRLKRVNDELGHEAGDRVLRQIGLALKRGLRGNDLIGRYGGDEFVALLPGLTREIAFERADQIIESVKTVNALLSEDLHIGMSVGIASYPFDAQDYHTLVRLADQAMYLAKRGGGNRVRTANDLRLFWEELPNTA
jgi:diguanylate cyclase (GGDEF)-like protein